MKRTRVLLAAALLSVASPGLAQSDPQDLTSLLETGRNLLETQGIGLEIPIDLTQTQKWLKDLQDRLGGEYVLDLSHLRPAAEAAIPWLESSEETQPYAWWLKTRLDYFRAADELQRLTPGPVPVPRKPESKSAPAPTARPKPTPEQQRQVWSKVVALEPWPEEAGKYVSQLKPVFTSEKVPSELVWIAEVESSFQPGARSPAGAAGLFQLMPGTAKQEGLRLWPLDQRYDPQKSARASAKYLRALHTEFKDWSLALAAYNAGDGQVRTLMKRHGVRSYDRLAPHLPAETQLYVPKVEAVLRRREGKALAELRTPS